MKKWILISSILSLLIGLAIGILIMYRPASPINSLEREQERIDSIQLRIDTLLDEKKEIELRIDSVIEERVIRVDSVKNLPPTEALEYLNRRLHENIN